MKAIVIVILSVLGVAATAHAFTLQGVSIPKQTFVSSGTDVHVSAWVPYWRGEGGTAEAQRTMPYIDTFSPFIYEVQKDGAVKNRSNITDRNWTSLIQTARANNKFIIPTILWLKGSEIESVLSYKTKREKHVQAILAIVDANPHFHGIDIDYEGKLVETRVGFSKFITELNVGLKQRGKYLVCTIETRNPNTPRGTIKEEERSNDFRVLGKECDYVRVMTYDQRNADTVLNARYARELYMPIADKEWVEKVLKELVIDIPKQKIELGIPTYGHVYKYTERPNGTYAYERMRALTYTQFKERVAQYGGEVMRHPSGELKFLYTIGSGEFKGNYVAFFSDAVSVAQKVRLAERYGIRGVAVFSISGANDPELPLNL